MRTRVASLVVPALLTVTLDAATNGIVPQVGVDTAGTFFSRKSPTNGMGWEFSAFRRAVQELGVDFLVDHYFHLATGGTFKENQDRSLERLRVLGRYLDETGLVHGWNLERASYCPRQEYVPGVSLFEPSPGLRHFNMPPDMLRAYAAHPRRQFVVFDEIEHHQIFRNRFSPATERNQHSALADTRKLPLPEAYECLLESALNLRRTYHAHRVAIVAESVWPVLHHLFARAGWTLAPKLLKESYTPVPVAMGLGAAIEYRQRGANLWLTPDLWHHGHYPGHGVEALRSAMLLCHWMGVERFYVENLDFVHAEGSVKVDGNSGRFDYARLEPLRRHPDAVGQVGSLVTYHNAEEFELTPYGEVFRWYAREYRPAHPVPYAWHEARCDVAIVRFPDSCWGQRSDAGWPDTLLGSDVARSTPETEAWVSILTLPPLKR